MPSNKLGCPRYECVTGYHSQRLLSLPLSVPVTGSCVTRSPILPLFSSRAEGYVLVINVSEVTLKPPTHPLTWQHTHTKMCFSLPWPEARWLYVNGLFNLAWKIPNFVHDTASHADTLEKRKRDGTCTLLYLSQTFLPLKVVWSISLYYNWYYYNEKYTANVSFVSAWHEVKKAICLPRSKAIGVINEILFILLMHL